MLEESGHINRTGRSCTRARQEQDAVAPVQQARRTSTIKTYLETYHSPAASADGAGQDRATLKDPGQPEETAAKNRKVCAAKYR